jgi:hypothetical protein
LQPEVRADGKQKSSDWRAACFTGTVRFGEARTRNGDRVTFERSDIFLPSPEELPLDFAADELDGVVVGFSDSGGQPRVFAVVEVVRRAEVVVPVDKLRVMGSGPEE